MFNVFNIIEKQRTLVKWVVRTLISKKKKKNHEFIQFYSKITFKNNYSRVVIKSFTCNFQKTPCFNFYSF
jgi:hypothetical protein